MCATGAASAAAAILFRSPASKLVLEVFCLFSYSSACCSWGPRNLDVQYIRREPSFLGIDLHSLDYVVVSLLECTRNPVPNRPTLGYPMHARSPIQLKRKIETKEKSRQKKVPATITVNASRLGPPNVPAQQAPRPSAIKPPFQSNILSNAPSRRSQVVGFTPACQPWKIKAGSMVSTTSRAMARLL